MAYFINKSGFASTTEIGIARDYLGQIILTIAGQDGIMLFSEQELLNLANHIKNVVYSVDNDE